MTPLWERATGRWRSILPALGIDPRFLTGKHGPCPMCGGRDRWRFDDKRGDGTWICTHCGAGNGIALAKLVTGVCDFKKIAEKIEAVLPQVRPDPVRKERDEAANRASLNHLWQTGRPVRPGDHVDQWMRGRGIHLSAYPACLRSHPGLRHSGPPVTIHPGMLAMVSAPSGKPMTIHRTYVTPNGTKASVTPVRMFCAGKVPPGCAVRLTPAMPTMGVAEGIETALAAAKLFDVPTWAGLNDRGVETFEPPPGTERLLIFGDNDENQVGQRAAWALAARLSATIKVDVMIPEQSDTDWDDVLLARSA
jgi:putative DNA primase/helicase